MVAYVVGGMVTEVSNGRWRGVSIVGGVVSVLGL